MGVIFRHILFVGGLSLVLGCAQGHCRRKAEAPGLASAPPVTKPAEGVVPSEQAERVFVYKYDGSLQCNAGKPIRVEAMAKELAGIQIFSSQKKKDGLMHIQVCGSITGMANVYEIPTLSLKSAEAKGFKVWSFD